MGIALLFWIAATGVLVGGRAAVDSAREEGVPAYVGARTAHAALSDADRAAWQSFRSGAAQLIGPGQRFRDDITTAGDSLSRIAEVDSGGAEGRDRLRSVNAQVVTYQGLVEQADATYRKGLEDLGYAYLTYASTMLHADGGLLDRIDEIAERDRAALKDRHASVWVTEAAVAAVCVIAAALLTLLGYVQAAMARRFRRVLNLPLLAASVLLVGLTAWFASTFLRVGDSFAAASERAMPAFDRTVRAQIAAADGGARALRADRPVGTEGGLDLAAAERAQRPLTARLGAATDIGGLAAGLPAGTAAVAGLAALGIWLRLREYRG
ncbi:hypothetical protein [Actinomadura algeriensis]|uniref:Secreted protein n=1 Tax=Actinomadura algeriensis TaxID=1679523 RepID=A0ABR9K3L5_9ACTN|nr:hypothetical protein [Actinomadura algeriensis]MBE1537194.1 hypothetical protein [Actinomadura algeriensis]